jgi:hypothetical protein
MGLEERGDEANQEEERSEYLESAKGMWRDGPEEDEPGWPQLHVKGPGMEVAKHVLLSPQQAVDETGLASQEKQEAGDLVWSWLVRTMTTLVASDKRMMERSSTTDSTPSSSGEARSPPLLQTSPLSPTPTEGGEEEQRRPWRRQARWGGPGMGELALSTGGGRAGAASQRRRRGRRRRRRGGARAQAAAGCGGWCARREDDEWVGFVVGFSGFVSGREEENPKLPLVEIFSTG